MEIPDRWGPLLVSAVRDAVLYQEQFMQSETLGDRTDYEEYHLRLTLLLEYVKDEYKRIEGEVGMPLDKIIRDSSPASATILSFSGRK